MLKMFEHVQKNNLASAYNSVHRRMLAYEERTRPMPSIPLIYIFANASVWSYAVQWRIQDLTLGEGGGVDFVNGGGQINQVKVL